MKMNHDKVNTFSDMMINYGRDLGCDIEIDFDAKYEKTEVHVTRSGFKKSYFVYWNRTKSLTDAAVGILVDLQLELRSINKFETKRDDILVIKDVIFNPPATIVFWEDGTKTVVKDQGEGYDPEKGLAMAISKKALGNQGNYYKRFAKWVGEFEKRNCEMTYPEVTFPLASELKKTFERIVDERINRLKNKQFYSFHQEPIMPVNPNYGFIKTKEGDENDET